MIKIIKTGRRRTVILTKKFAIKIPCIHRDFKSFLKGMIANIDESNEFLNGSDRLCPILISGFLGLFVVMPRCVVLTQDEFQKLGYDSFVRVDARTYLPVRPRAKNFGWLNGKIVAINYVR
jgi:hypothetical protein